MKVAILHTTKFEGETQEQLLRRSERQINAFHSAGMEVSVTQTFGFNDEEMAAACQGADVLYCNGNPVIDRYVIERCPKLKIIQRSGIGVNSIDLDAAAEHGIPAMNVVGYCIEELAVHSTAMILANMRTLTFYDRELRAGKWPKGKGRVPPRVSELTVGLYGLGGSGRLMARIWGAGFGCRIIACDPYLTPEQASEAGAKLVDFDSLCRESDVISIHVPLNAETTHAFDERAFSLMKPGCIIANVARGAIIDERAMCEALRSGRIMAALDTFEEEPLPSESPLLEMSDRTVLTPHSAYCGTEASKTLIHIACALPVKALQENIYYRPYIANSAVIPHLEARGCVIRNELLE